MVLVINWDNQCCKFTDVSDLRSRLLSNFENFIHEDTFQLDTFNQVMAQKADKY